MSSNKRRLDTLRRRRDYLAKAIEAEDIPTNSYDEAEKGALDWAIDKLENLNGTTKAVPSQAN